MSAPTRPRIVIDPESGLINPLSIFNSVVLPAPVMPNQPQAFPPAKLEGDILVGVELARTETVRGVERRESRDERRGSRAFAFLALDSGLWTLDTVFVRSFTSPILR